MPLTLRISQAFLWSEIGKLQVCKHSSNRMVIAQSAESLMQRFLNERKEKGLKFALPPA